MVRVRVWVDADGGEEYDEDHGEASALLVGGRHCKGSGSG